MENHKQINNTHLLFFAGFLYFFAGCAQPPPPQPETPPLPEEPEITAKPALMVEPEPASELKQEIIVLPPIIVQDTIHKEIVLPPITIQDTVHEEIVLPKYNRVIVQDTIHKEIVLPPVIVQDTIHKEIVLPPIIVQDTIHEEIVLPPIIVQDTIHKEIVLPPITIQDTVHVEYVVFPGSSTSTDDFSYLSDLQFLYPCEGVTLPEEPRLLPNAPRSYRHGIHRGIDFVANYSSEVRAVASGTVIRADHHYEEFNPAFREELLAEAAAIGRTPSDVFNNILVGQSVIIDHGTELVTGKRLISIYAHLSHIDSDIQVGSTVVQGQQLGLSGNSGTKPATLGGKSGAHLHFELIIQDAEGERYLGQELTVEEVKALLEKLFIE